MLVNTAVKNIKRYSHRGDQAITTDQITSDILASINVAGTEVLRMLPKRWLWKQGTISVAIGTPGTPQVYSLPSDCQELDVIHYESGQKVFTPKKIDSDREWFSNTWNPTSAASFPYFYREIGPDGSRNKQIEIFPVSHMTQTFKLEYYKDPAMELTTSDLGSEFPDIPPFLDDVMWKGGLYYFLKGFDDPLQNQAKTDYDKAVEAITEHEEMDLDSDLSFRWGKSRTSIETAKNGMRIY